MKKIKLHGNKYAMVDDSDFNLISNISWHIKKHGRTFYAKHSNRLSPNTVYMHTLIMGKRPNMEIDHVDGNGLNNQKNNLRFSTHAENTRNVRIRKDNKSGMKGVFFRKDLQKWSASIGFQKKRIYLGLFASKKEATEAYIIASGVFHQEYSNV